MKKCFACLLAALLLFSAASAQTITAMATEPYMETYALYMCYARIHDYDSKTNMLEVELITPEVFDKEEVENLSVGDGIFTDGQEVVISAIENVDGYIVINRGDYPFSDDSVWLAPDFSGNYRSICYDDITWMEMARIEIPVTDDLLLLDMIDPETGEPLERAAVHSAAEFLRIKADEENGSSGGPGFCTNNVMVVFGKDGQLSIIQRYYVPWQ